MFADMQYSPSLQGVAARQVEGAWQVRGLPLVSSLQEVEPVIVEQSEAAAQITKKLVGYPYGSMSSCSPSLQMFDASQYSPELQSFVHERDS